MRKQKSSAGKDYKKTVIARISEQKFEELVGILSRSRLRTMSELLRDILDNRKITVEYYDKTLDKVMLELSEIRRELQSIGVNINQVTKRFHVQQWPEAMLINAEEIAGLYQQIDLRMEKLFSAIDQIAQKWLPE